MAYPLKMHLKIFYEWHKNSSDVIKNFKKIKKVVENFSEVCYYKTQREDRLLRNCEKGPLQPSLNISVLPKVCSDLRLYKEEQAYV